MKVAASLDGTTALADGSSQWITSPEARTDGHAWRARAGAVLTGVGTVLRDDPRLDVRLVGSPHQPMAVVVDSQLRLPSSAQLLKAQQRPVLVYGSNAPAIAQRGAQLQAHGATVVPMSHTLGHVDLAAMLDDLARREVNELHVEAGATLNGALLRAGLVDEFLIYLAPRMLGSGMGMTNLGPLAALTDGVPLQFMSVERVGPDLRILARIPGRDVF